MAKLKHDMEYRWTKERLDKVSVKWIEWLEEKYEANEIPYMNAFCFEHGLQPKNMNTYMNYSKLMSQAHALAKEVQAHMICKHAMAKKADGNFAKFFLGSIHGMRDTVESMEAVSGFKEFMDFVKQKGVDAQGTQSETDPGDNAE